MATPVFNLILDQYSDFSATITLADINGVPLNLTGYTAAASMKKSYYSSTSYPFTVEFFDRPQGIIKLKMTSTQTSLLEAGRYVYDVVITDVTLKKMRVAEGIVTVTEGVTA